MPRPRLSIVVILFDMRREAARTLLSLSAGYQRGVSAEDYEVIVIDNGSSRPFDAAAVGSFGANMRYEYLATDSVSPVDAVNLGARLARGDLLALIVDGARMATPGLVAASLSAAALAPAPFVASLSWHLGPDVQRLSVPKGYDQETEDALLAEIGWPEDGYRLFEIASLAPSSEPGFLGGMPKECSWFCLPRQLFTDTGGFDTRFLSPGGGLCNHEFRDRVLAVPGVTPIVLLGEGVFHQVHGGAATGQISGPHPMQRFGAEYQEIFGRPYRPASVPGVTYIGQMPEAARRFLAPDALTPEAAAARGAGSAEAGG